MNAVDRLVGYFSPTTGLARARARERLTSGQRFYDAAKPGRQNAGWRRPFTSAASETYAALPYLRASSHDLGRNNPHAAKIISSLATGLIGNGIRPQANTGNKRLNKKVDALAKRFFRTMDADGITENFAAFQLLLARAFLEGGEAVIRKYVRPVSLGLPVPLQFALLEGDFIDNQKNNGEPNGNRVVQGIEFDTKNRLRVAYHMFKEHPGDTYMAALEGSYEHIRVPASDVRLVFEPQRPGQIRGVPWITPILVRAKLLDDYEDAERQRKRTESSINAIVKGNSAVSDGGDDNITSLFPTVVDGDGRPVEVVTPGSIVYARDATDIEMPKVADAMGYAPYKRSELQSIAAGARSSYELASGDLSQTSYSSAQFGLLDYRAMVDQIRHTIIVPKLDWMWREMIAMAIMAGILPEGTPDDAEWHAPPWLPIDPEKQANADLLDIRSGKRTLREVVIARGKDFDDHLDELEAGNKALDKRKIILDSDPRRTDRRGVEQQAAANAKGDAASTPEANPDQA